MPNTTSPEINSQSIDRNSASKLNPLIGIDEMETLGRCQEIFTDLGYVISASSQFGMEINMKNWFRMFETASAAMQWEIEGLLIERRVAGHVSLSAIDSIDKIIATFIRSKDSAETEDIVNKWAESGGLRDVLVAMVSGVAK